MRVSWRWETREKGVMFGRWRWARRIVVVVVLFSREKGLKCDRRVGGIEDRIAIVRSYRRLAMSHSMLVDVGNRVDSSGNDVRSGDLSGLWRIGL